MAAQDVVLITGCATGIGRALAIELSGRKKEGGKAAFKVHATDSNLAALKDLRKYGIVVSELDVTSNESVKKAVEDIIAGDGHIDVLVCNAGVHCGGFLAEIDYADVEKTFDVNVHGTFRVIQAAAPYMQAQRKGRIATMCDVQSCFARPFYGPYEGSKASLAMMSEGLCLELASFGVSVTSVYAGWVQTDFLKQGLTDFSQYEKSSSYYQTVVGYFRQLLKQFASTGLPAETAAADIADGLIKEPAPRFVYTGTSVWSTFFRGFTQQWVSNSLYARYLISQSGLGKLAQAAGLRASEQIPLKYQKEE